MTQREDKGAFQADIPEDAVAEAVASVEKVAAAAPAPASPPADPEAVARENESLKAQLELSQQKGRETLDRLKDEHERLLRTAADFDNYKKRAAREREDVQRFGNEKLLKELLPVVDNLDRALAAAPPGDPLVDGVRLVRTSLEQVLSRHGVTSFSAMGEKFDPALHEALLQVPAADKPPGTVVLEHARGFKLNDRLIRPAMVGVAAEPVVTPPPTAGGETPKT
jgi:molecular chaperone GrpE